MDILIIAQSRISMQCESEDKRKKAEHQPLRTLWGCHGGGKLPNNWASPFEGKAWAWDEVRQA